MTHVIPSPWIGLILALGTFRLVRLLAWDTFPPAVRARAWVLGEEVTSTGSLNARQGLTGEPMEVTVRYRRQFLADLFHCAYCLGFWLSILVYLAWVFEDKWTLYIAVPFALSGIVGIIARVLDP